jgi:hypothetical protein
MQEFSSPGLSATYHRRIWSRRWTWTRTCSRELVVILLVTFREFETPKRRSESQWWLGLKLRGRTANLNVIGVAIVGLKIGCMLVVAVMGFELVVETEVRCSGVCTVAQW